MLAATSTALATIGTIALVLLILGVSVYAVVRPFTHLRYRHRSGLWSHLP